MNYTDLKNKVLSKVAGLALEVEPLDDNELKAKRIEVCESNAGSCFDAQNRKCKMCGCYIDAKAGIKINRNPKQGMRSEVTHCPLGKWDDLELANHYRVMDNLKVL